jgi:hypothetical protein
MWSLIWSPDGQRLGVLSFAEDGYAALANGDGELASIALKTPGDRLVIVPKGEQMWGTCGLSWQRLGD